ncbi:hypothetical protein QZH41_012573 [Actinostola sp. cb2023]|nr:hypothetical protein QZH41_012573 [Actinostola sp. cb2023]
MLTGFYHISISIPCTLGSSIHELGHAIGFFHEHSRPDRDDFININTGNIRRGAKGNFRKDNGAFVDSRGHDYDYGSIMHYSRYQGNNRRGAVVIQPKKANVEIGQRNGLSDADIVQTKDMYKCDGETITSIYWTLRARKASKLAFFVIYNLFATAQGDSHLEPLEDEEDDDEDSGDCKLGQVIHELGHTLGVFHEQSRPDRDNYVRIFLKNLAQKYKWAKGQFEGQFGVGYDYGSIMHYGKDAFAGRGKITVQPKDRDARIGQRRALSNADIEQLNKMYNCAEGKHVVKRAAMKSQWLWPGGVVFYKLSTNLDNAGKGRIREAIRRIEAKTCIRFRQRTNEANYVLMQYDFKKGQKKSYADALSISRYCGVGSIVHELGHCLGFFHEQSRPDRDNYVTIDLANLAPKYKNAKGNFDKVDRRYVDARGVDYDYGSMMHYGKYAFAARGKITIQPKDRKARIGQRRALSRADIQQLNKMYNC